MAVFFNGRLLITPTTASAVNDDAMQNRNLTVGNIVCFIGKATGGEPKKVLAFGDPTQAKAVLRSGELLDAVLKGFDPSAQTPAPSTIYALRVNPAERAMLTLNHQDEGPLPVVDLFSVNYGQADNQIKVKIEDGTDVGKRLTVQQGQSYYTGDNVGRAAFSVLYTGTGSGTVSVDTNLLNLDGGGDFTQITLEDFPTVGELVDRINVVPGFTALVLEDSYDSPTVNGLDFVGTANCKTSPYTVRADLQAVVDWFNSGSQPLVTAVRYDGADVPPDNIPFTYLSGGTDGVTTNTDWSNGFGVLQRSDFQWLCPLSGSTAIRAMADAHVAFCSTVLGKERRAITGTDADTPDVDALAAAKELNSDRTSLVHLGFYDYNAAGKLVLRPPYMTAALIAAMFSGVNPGTPLTNKTLKVRGLERDLLNPTETDPLLKGGVLCVENTEEGFKVVQSISTWLANDKYTKVEQSTGAALDFTVRNVRKAVDILRGEKGNPLLLSRAVSITESTLKELARAEPQGPGVLAGDTMSPAYRNIRATLEGDVTRIQFECSPVIPNNYILVTVFAVPYSGSATAAVA